MFVYHVTDSNIGDCIYWAKCVLFVLPRTPFAPAGLTGWQNLGGNPCVDALEMPRQTTGFDRMTVTRLGIPNLLLSLLLTDLMPSSP